jgi:arylsulfatase A-like enzyme
VSPRPLQNAAAPPQQTGRTRAAVSASRSTGRRSIRHPLHILALIALCGCAPPEDLLDEVALRLEPQQFGLAPTRPTMLTIGDEARPVIIGQENIIAGQWTVRTGQASLSLPVDLPPGFTDAPDAAFSVGVQDLPDLENLPEDVQREFTATPFWFTLGDEWRLERRSGSQATLHIHRRQAPSQVGIHSFRLVAHPPTPTHLQSSRFDIPPRARLRLAVGVGARAKDSGPQTAAADLQCDGLRPQHLVDFPLTQAHTWTEREIPVTAAQGCVLTLRLRPDAGSNAAWAVPQLRAARARLPATHPTGLVLVSLDTVGAEHLSGYGYGRPTTPRIDTELIARGTTFDDASCTFPMTDVSHLSLLTGLYPGAQPQPGRLAPGDAIKTLGELLQARGFTTAAATEDGLLSGALGFSTGFDRFQEKHLPEADRGWITFATAETFLRSVGDDRFFLLVHTYKAHSEYHPSPGYRELWQDPTAWQYGGPAPLVPEKHRAKVDAYDRTIREADDLVGRLLEILAELALDQRTLVVLVSDHGEAFGEAGVLGHGLSPHQTTLHVPLVFHGPGIPAGRRIAAPVSLVDVLPTVIDLLGLPSVAQGQGRSLAAAFRTPEVALPDRKIFFAWLNTGGAGMRDQHRKVVSTATSVTGYDLRLDPHEQQPVALTNTSTWTTTLARHLEENATLRQQLAAQRSGTPTVDATTRDALRELGYVE